ncbi:MAG: putative ribonuclease III [Candidatus Berkelbacteria bacterium Licking1014_85]|uniref:Ribonuclease 3 n=1 Tax=Candidatus Berkelbacteria bacterium Licking1014_85 TaxID=2017148 RepID=A0A554LML3_9BACT|nr:MAG: putative ribonuclease III [Candidatus Berkelbacteria bacterium Licking1014_85]
MTSIDNDQKFKDFSEHIGVNFKNFDILKTVFVHRSYLNEHPSFKLDQNERLEFLGDAVLELVVTQYLYENFPNPEGELTNWRAALVKGESLSKISSDLGINDLLFMSKGESKSTGRARDLILANAFEALIGATYIDSGLLVAEQFIIKYVICKLDDILENKLYLDSKSRLQEWSQAKYGITPEYKVISETGPDHNKHFDIDVYIGDEKIGTGSGRSKQNAQQEAAYHALENYIKLLEDQS